MRFLHRLKGKPTETRPETTDEREVPTSGNPQQQDLREPVVELPHEHELETVQRLPADESEAHSDAQAPIIDVEGPTKIGTRPLPPLETVLSQPGQCFQFSVLSDVGMVRSNNQDAGFGVLSLANSNDNLPDFGVFMVADGMGGHQEGERASAIAVRLVSRYVTEHIFVPLLNQQLNDPDRPSITDVLRGALQEANEVVTEAIPEGGTTATVAVLLGELVYIAHVGDSRAYLLSKDGIEQITRDHSLVQRLIELGQLTAEEAADYPQRNLLYKAIGQSDTLEPDTLTRRLQPGMRLMLCSDGLWNLVPEETILDYARRYDRPQELSKQLIDLANERGGSDNITVVLLQAPG